ncbi:MAG: beta-mannosidase [Armatimonadota bacterium]
MSKQLISLDGQWHVAGHNSCDSKKMELRGSVPGHVHIDLLRAELIKDPFWRDQADDCQWVEDWDWTYSREFTLPEDFNTTWAVLDFAGLDTYAQITLNGETIGCTDNMFIKHRFDVSGKLRPGNNGIEVRFSSFKKMIEGKLLEPYPAAFFTSERVHVRRMQCTFHWDWVNRFVSAGIWRPVKLYSYDTAFVSDLFVYTQSIADNQAKLVLDLEVEKRVPDDVRASVEILDPDGKLAWSSETPVRDKATWLSASVESPKLWWPNGSGEQPLYSCRVTLLGDDGSKLDGKETTFGIRTVRIEQIEDKPCSPEWDKTTEIRGQCPALDKNGDEPGSSFTLVVNGERIFCKGANWVPADPFPSRITTEHYDRLIKLARDANINLLRCWGGGIYEPEAFWDACNRYGIMVSQDFQMACAKYPEDDPEFMDNLRAEIPSVIKMLRNHPSLAWWCGDNENGMNHDYDDPNYPGRKIADEISGPACRELDPSRCFMPTSPYLGKSNSSLTMGDCHYSGLWDHDLQFVSQSDMKNYRERINIVGRFISESAIFGAPPMRSLLKFMTKEDVASPDKRMWEYHTKDNPHKPNNVNITLFGMLERAAEKLFRPSDDIQTKVRKMEYVHYHWIRLTVEAARRNKWYCSGVQFWMYNDCWPASGWSIVDYYGFPKAGYYAMRQASKGLIASIQRIQSGYRVWVCNDLLQSASGELELRVQPWTGEPRWSMKSAFDVAANSSQIALEVPDSELSGKLGLDSVLVCDIHSELGCDRAFYYPGMPYEMTPPPTKLGVRRVNGDGSGKLIMSTNSYARVVTLDAELDFSDNYFDLLPGEERTIEWSDPSGSTESPNIGVTCWNI